MTDISTTLEDWFTTEGDAMTHDEPTDTAGAAPAGDEGPATGTDEGRGDDGAQCSA
jgi:hypothetical protein